MLLYIIRKLPLSGLDAERKIVKLLMGHSVKYVQSLQRLPDISHSKYLHLPKFWHRHAKHFESCMFSSGLCVDFYMHKTFQVECWLKSHVVNGHILM